MNENKKEKTEETAEQKMARIARSMAVEINKIIEIYKTKYEIDENGKIAILTKNTLINENMQTEINKQIKLHAKLMLEIYDYASIKEAMNATIAVIKGISQNEKIK